MLVESIQSLSGDNNQQKGFEQLCIKLAFLTYIKQAGIALIPAYVSYDISKFRKNLYRSKKINVLIF